MRISRRQTLIAGVTAIVLSVSTGPTSAQTPGHQPNIVWIVCEDITTFIGAYGSPVRTPNIDRLAAEGIRYTHAYQVAGVCAPARASVITGMYATSIGAHNMRTGKGELTIPGSNAQTMPDGLPTYSVVLPENVRAFPEYLRKAGYYTSNNQKTDYQFEAPVTVWDESSPAASYRNRPVGKPFFSVFNFFLTHESMIALRKDPLLTDPAKVDVPPIYPDTQNVRNGIARMYTNIELMDRQVGELIQQLKDEKLYDDTVIFFFSDNGGNLPWFKREILERGAKVPLIVKLPKAEHAGETDDALVSGVDFAPTVLSLAGLPIPAYMQGQAFLGEQKAQIPRKYVFAARDRMDAEYDRVRMVRDIRYRYLYNYRPELPYYQNIGFRLTLPMMTDILTLRDQGKLDAIQSSWFKTKPVEELYDAENDPWEIHNLADDPDHRDKLVELRAAFHDWTKTFGDMGAIPETEMLRAMWNGGNVPPATAKPVISKTDGGVRIDCATPGASIGYWIEHPGAAEPTQPHVVRSWDYEHLAGEMIDGDFAKNGDKRPVPTTWNVYNGNVISLKRGETIHVNAMRIGYQEALADYTTGVTDEKLK